MNELTYFHVCDGSLLPDIMHNVLEGALQYEVKFLLERMVKCDNYFALETLNSRLENLDLGYMDVKNRPTPISTKQLNSDGSSLKQMVCVIYLIFSIADVATWTYFAYCYWKFCTGWR